MKPDTRIQPRTLSIRTRLLALLLALTVISLATLATLGVEAIQRAGRDAEETSSATLRAQAQESLLQLTQANAEKYDLILLRVRNDAEILAQYSANILDDSTAFHRTDYWKAEEHMTVGAAGQFHNNLEDITSVFVPNFKTRDEELIADLETSAYLDFTLPATYEGDSNSVAVYLGTETEITRYYPNIGLGTILAPDFQVTQRPWYVAAAPDQNSQRETIWSQVYEDVTGQGLMVTAVSPVYAKDGEFLGAVGIDVTLADLRANIENTASAAGGYLFLVDSDGRAIALPEQGYRDVLGRRAEAEEFGTPLSTAPSAFITSVLEPMQEGLTGFVSLNLHGRELFIAYAPLQSTDWSIGSIVEADQMLAAIAEMRNEIERSTNILVVRRILPAGIIILIGVVLVGMFLSRRLASPIQKLATVAQQIGSGQLDTEIPRGGGVEIDVLAEALRDMSKQLQEVIKSLEQRVAERTQALEKRARQLEAAAEVAHAATAMLDVNALISRVVTLISERFGFYHAGIFLLDQAKEYAVLRAASSKGGERMLARQHRLRTGREGIVGYVTDTGQPRIALDVGKDAVFFDNPDLPETRSEMALPLRAHDEIIGALDVQSTEEAAFTDEDVAVLQTLADQVALAISNARFYREAQERMEELRRAYGEFSRQAWIETAQTGEILGFRYTRHGTVADPEVWNEEMEKVLQTGQPVYGPELTKGQQQQTTVYDQSSTLALPVKVYDQIIGALDIRKPGQATQWDAEEVELVHAVVDQLGLALERAKLVQEAQRRAVREELVGEATAHMRETLDMETVLRTAVDEIYQALGLDEVAIYLSREIARQDGHSQDV